MTSREQQVQAALGHQRRTPALGQLDKGRRGANRVEPGQSKISTRHQALDETSTSNCKPHWTSYRSQPSLGWGCTEIAYSRTLQLSAVTACSVPRLRTAPRCNTETMISRLTHFRS